MTPESFGVKFYPGDLTDFVFDVDGNDADMTLEALTPTEWEYACREWRKCNDGVMEAAWELIGQIVQDIYRNRVRNP